MQAYSNLMEVILVLCLLVACSEKPRTTDSLGASKQYTAQEIVSMIKALPEYVGDSVQITRNGKIITSNSNLQATFKNVLKDGKGMLEIESESTGVPFQVLLYKNAVNYHYKVQFPDDVISLKNINIDTLLMQEQGMTVVKKANK